MRPSSPLAIAALLAAALPAYTAEARKVDDWFAGGALEDFARVDKAGASWIVTSTGGRKLKLTPYGDDQVRVQAIDQGQDFLADERYETVIRHDKATDWSMAESAAELTFTGEASGGLEVVLAKRPLRLTFKKQENHAVLLAEPRAAGAETGGRSLELKINGLVAQPKFAFPPTRLWSEWRTVEVPVVFRQGQNTIRLSSIGESGPNIDRLEIEGISPPFEAEAATNNGTQEANEHGGYSGRGYADFLQSEGEWVEWTVNVQTAGTRRLKFRYANGAAVAQHFEKQLGEHFAGLGHGPFGRVSKLDLAGQVIERNRDSQQSPLLVPFFLSSRGYGIFVNDPHKNRFAFQDGDYSFALQGGRVDYFVIRGEPAVLLDRYTALTGRPALPPLSAFTLQLSDKKDESLPSDEAWWVEQVNRLKAGRYPVGVIVHDNCWRGGKTAPWEWDPERYADPSRFAEWSRQQDVVNFMDFNRADAELSDGWSPRFAVPGTDLPDWPDFSSQEVRDWFWKLLWDKSFNPELNYPGDFLWLDEFDELLRTTERFADGRDLLEHANDYFFLMAKAVGEGWARDFRGAKRPFVMARGMTAGAQRWASLWSGDLELGDAEMRLSIRGMLAAGLSGFPYWGHDQGGFKGKPSDSSYRRWSLAQGSFSPIWKPHGLSFRFPWLFSQEAQNEMRLYGALRMALMPYTYAAAHVANATGLPIARAMLLAYPNQEEAWGRDQQYLWGDSLLVAPDTLQGNGLWLPPGAWYSYWTDQRLQGGRLIARQTVNGRMPLYVKAGAILPMAEPEMTLKETAATLRYLDVYVGADGRAQLVDDDGVSEGYATGQIMKTTVAWQDAARKLVIGAALGTYPGAPALREYRIRVHGLSAPLDVRMNGQDVGDVSWDAGNQVLEARLGGVSVRAEKVVEFF